MPRQKKKASDGAEALKINLLEVDGVLSQEYFNTKIEEIASESDAYSQLFRGDGHYVPPKEQSKARHFTFIVYPESAPPDWEERMNNTGLPWTRSPLHGGDTNPDGSRKKIHYHCIVSYANTTTYKSASETIRAITNGPYPQVCRSVAGAYAYFTHKHNPEKAQYDASEIKRFNGWSKVLESTEVRELMDEMTMLVLTGDCREYAELVVESRFSGNFDAYEVIMNHTLYFDKLIASYRNSPIRVLNRWLQYVDDDDQRQVIIERMKDIELEEASRRTSI